MAAVMGEGIVELAECLLPVGVMGAQFLAATREAASDQPAAMGQDLIRPTAQPDVTAMVLIRRSGVEQAKAKSPARIIPQEILSTGTNPASPTRLA